MALCGYNSDIQVHLSKYFSTSLQDAFGEKWPPLGLSRVSRWDWGRWCHFQNKVYWGGVFSWHSLAWAPVQSYCTQTGGWGVQKGLAVHYVARNDISWMNSGVCKFDCSTATHWAIAGVSVCIVQIFLSYDDYLEQLDLYMRREWTCALSKRKNLTFEEVRVHL